MEYRSLPLLILLRKFQGNLRFSSSTESVQQVFSSWRRATWLSSKEDIQLMQYYLSTSKYWTRAGLWPDLDMLSVFVSHLGYSA